MADVHHLISCLAKGCDHSCGVVRGGFDATQWPFTLGEVVVLDIDYDERLLGHGGFLDKVCGASIGSCRQFEDWPQRQ